MRIVHIALLTATLLGWCHRASASDAASLVADYQSQARRLGSLLPDPRHPGEIHALRTLADALDAMPGATAAVRQATAAIRRDADTLASAPVTAVHSDTTRDALVNALRALDGLQAANPQLADRIQPARDQVAKIDPAVPFLQQRATIDQAFVDIGLALAPAGGPAVGRTLPPEERQPVAGQEPPQVAMAAPPLARMRMYQLSAGGGVVDFAQDNVAHLTEIGGAWDVRFLVGDSSFLAGEAAYVGTANSPNNVLAGFAPNSVIIGTAAEFDLRLQLPHGWFPVRPFGFWGAGWQNFTLVNQSFRDKTAIPTDTDNSFVMPFGAGAQADLGEHWDVDARFTYRAMFDEGLIHTTANGVPGVGSQGMSQWALTARLGYSF